MGVFKEGFINIEVCVWGGGWEGGRGWRFCCLRRGGVPHVSCLWWNFHRTRLLVGIKPTRGIYILTNLMLVFSLQSTWTHQIVYMFSWDDPSDTGPVSAHFFCTGNGRGGRSEGILFAFDGFGTWNLLQPADLTLSWSQPLTECKGQSSRLVRWTAFCQHPSCLKFCILYDFCWCCLFTDLSDEGIVLIDADFEVG